MSGPWEGVYFAQRDPVIDWGPSRPLTIRPSRESLIKIGWSSDVMRRVKEMQTAHAERLWVIGLIQSVPRQYERYVHRAYRDLRTSGEWFKPSAELVGLIAGIGTPDEFLREQAYARIHAAVRQRRGQPPRGALIAENPEIML